MTLTDHDLSALLAALKAGEMTETVRTSLEWILQALIEAATTVIGTGPHERTETRTNQRTGTAPGCSRPPPAPLEQRREGRPALQLRDLQLDVEE